MAPQEYMINSFLALDASDYVKKVIQSCRPFVTAVVACIIYIMFPEPAYLTAFYAVLGAMALDMITKWWAIWCSPNARLSSQSLARGTIRKIFTYMVIFVLTGLSYRVAPVASAAVFLGTFVYTIFFLREAVSIVENLCDAGYELEWLLLVVKKRHDKIMEDELGGAIVEPSNMAPLSPTNTEQNDTKKGGIQ